MNLWPIASAIKDAVQAEVLEPSATVRHIIDDNAANAEVVSGWIEKWSPLASEALEALADVTAEAPVPSDPSAVATRITDEVSRELGAALER